MDIGPPGHQVTADAFEVRPPGVEALQWQPGDIDTVGRVLAWLEFAGAEPRIERMAGQPEWPFTAETHISIRPDPFRPGRCYVRPGQWVVRDERYGGRFVVRHEQQFTTEYRRQQS